MERFSAVTTAASLDHTASVTDRDRVTGFLTTTEGRTERSGFQNVRRRCRRQAILLESESRMAAILDRPNYQILGSKGIHFYIEKKDSPTQTPNNSGPPIPNGTP